jgi:Yip1 domain
MADAATPAPAPAATTSDNSFSRIFGVIFSPKPTFDSIVRRPTWIVPVILGCILFIAVVAVFTQRGGWPAFFEKQDANNSRMQSMSAEERERALETQIKVGPIFGYAEGVIIPPIAALVAAGVLLLVFNLSGATKVDFKTSLAIVAFAWVPWLIHGLLSILILFLKDASTVDLQNIVASNPGALLSDDAAKWLSVLLGSFDIFAFWTLILLAIGYSATNPKKLSIGKALILAIIPWIFYTAIKVGLTAALS